MAVNNNTRKGKILKTLFGVCALLNCSIGFSQIEAEIRGPDSLFIGQNSEYFVDVVKLPNRFLSTDTVNDGFLKTEITGTELSGTFTYDIRVKPGAAISMMNECENGWGDERYSLANTTQNWVIVPSEAGPGMRSVGLTVGTNGIMVGERSGTTLISSLSYSFSIPDWVHVAVVCRNDSMFLYADGTLVRSRIIPDTDIRTLPSKLAGRCYSQTYKGSLDEFRIWDYALSAEEVGIIKDKKMLGHDIMQALTMVNLRGLQVI
jgi:hypothetical protein